MPSLVSIAAAMLACFQTVTYQHMVKALMEIDDIHTGLTKDPTP